MVYGCHHTTSLMVEREIETHRMNSARERGFFSLADEPMVTGSINSVLAKLNSTKLKKNHPKIMEVLCQGVVNLKKGFDKLGGGRVMDPRALLWTMFARDLVFDIEEWIDEPKAAYLSERESKGQGPVIHCNPYCCPSALPPSLLRLPAAGSSLPGPPARRGCFC